MRDMQTRQHDAAVMSPNPGFEKAVMGLMDSVQEYADAHRKRYDDLVGDDGYIGVYIEEIVEGIKGILSGEIGRLSGGIVEQRLRVFAAANHLKIPE